MLGLRGSLLETQTGAALAFPRQVHDLFTQALAQRDRFAASKPSEEDRERAYNDYLGRLCALTYSPRSNDDNERFAKHLYKHASGWFLFLVDPTIPATNHRAEQALKTPITNRKVWGGNRTDIGAHVQGVTSSVIETCKNTTQNAFTFVSNAFRGIVSTLFIPISPVPANETGR